MGHPATRHSFLLKTRFKKRIFTITLGKVRDDVKGEPDTITRQASMGYIAINRGIECPSCHWNTDQLPEKIRPAQDEMDYHMEMFHA